MTGIFRLSPRAHSDLRNIWNYIAADNFEAADRYVDSIIGTIELIARNPKLGRDCEKLLSGGRRFVAKHHLIFYRIEGDRIGVLHIVRETQDVVRLFKRLKDV